MSVYIEDHVPPQSVIIKLVFLSNRFSLMRFIRVVVFKKWWKIPFDDVHYTKESLYKGERVIIIIKSYYIRETRY